MNKNICYLDENGNVKMDNDNYKILRDIRNDMTKLQFVKLDKSNFFDVDSSFDPKSRGEFMNSGCEVSKKFKESF